MSSKGRSHGLIYAILASNLVSIFLFMLRMLSAGNFRYWFLFWNLVLAWVPLFFALRLNQELKTKSWRKPELVILTLLWLFFLPNGFYLISDLIHLQSTGEINVLFDAVLFMSLIWNGLIAGMGSIYVVHKQIAKRLNQERTNYIILGVFFASSFAIYLGRSLRWNSWDVLFNPAALLFDVSERVINPLSHPQVVVTTATFFLLLTSIYAVIWQAAAYMKDKYAK